MTKKKYISEKPTRRFCEAKDGPFIQENYPKYPTAIIAKWQGLIKKQVDDYVYSHNEEDWAKKDPDVKSQINRENGKKGGRPRKKP